MKRWLVGPLKDKRRIDERLDAVSGFVANKQLRKGLSAALKKLPDLERLVTRIYTYSVKSHVAAIYIDMKVLTRLSEFYDLIKVFKAVKNDIVDQMEIGEVSSRLNTLIDKEFPDYDPILQDFEEMIVWKSTSGKKIPEPKPGVDE